MNQASKLMYGQGIEGGWYRIAWAFLKVRGINSVLNVDKQLRLQLYAPPKTKWISSCYQTAPTDVYGWWHRSTKKKYPYTLFVTVKGVLLPKLQPSLRSMCATQEEKGSSSSAIDSASNDIQNETSNPSGTGKTKETCQNSWNRLPGQSCRIPESLNLSLDAGHSGCFVVKFSTNGKYLAGGSSEGTSFPIVVFEIPSGKLKKKLVGHFGIIYQLIWSLDDKILLSVSSDCTLRLWNTSDFEATKTTSRLLPHPSYIYCAAFHPLFPNLVVSGCYDSVLRMWRTEDCELVQELSAHSSFVNTVCFDEGDKLFSGDGQGLVCVWNTKMVQRQKRKGFRDWKLIQKLQLPELKGVVINNIIYHPGGRRILISSRDSSIRMVDTESLSVLHHYTGFQNVNDLIHCCVTPCGNYVLSGSEDGIVYVWKANTEELVHKYTKVVPSKKTVTGVDFHPKDHLLAFCAFGDNLPILVFKESAPVILKGPKHLPPLLRPTKPRKVNKNGSLSGILKSTENSLNYNFMPEELHKSVAFMDANKSQSRWKQVLDRLDEVLVEVKKKRNQDSSPDQNQNDAESTGSTSVINNTVSSWGSTFDHEDNVLSNSNSGMVGLDSPMFYVVAGYSYIAEDTDQLSLQPGDVLQVHEKVNDDWFYGTSMSTKNAGFFPTTYTYPYEGVPDPPKLSRKKDSL